MNRMSSRPLLVLTVALGAFGALWAAPFGAAAQTPPAAQAQHEGDWILDTRLRYEGVEQDGLLDADALTLRARLGYETAAWRGLRLLGEVEGVAHLVDDFNDTVNGNTAYAVVTDPEAFELNRLQLSWTGAEGRRAIVGRQRIILNNARFIGNSGFRQNEQTFDAVRLEAKPFEHLGLTYVFIDQVRRVLGDDSPQGEWDSDSHLLQADLTLPLGRLSAYGVLLDFQNAAAQSSQTYGARWTHEWDLDGWRPRLTLEAAAQSDYRGNTPGFDLGYQHAEFGLRRDRWTVHAGGERLEGDGARGFSTPLATLHAFQGWADVFTTTPAGGVRDLYAGVSYQTAPWPAGQPVTFSLIGHDYSDDDDDVDYGSEWNGLVRVQLTERAAVEAKAAWFEGEAGFADRNRFWLALEYKL